MVDLHDEIAQEAWWYAQNLFGVAWDEPWKAKLNEAELQEFVDASDVRESDKHWEIGWDVPEPGQDPDPRAPDEERPHVMSTWDGNPRWRQTIQNQRTRYVRVLDKLQARSNEWCRKCLWWT